MMASSGIQDHDMKESSPIPSTISLGDKIIISLKEQITLIQNLMETLKKSTPLPLKIPQSWSQFESNIQKQTNQREQKINQLVALGDLSNLDGFMTQSEQIRELRELHSIYSKQCSM